jgi:hypothetical protein
MCRKIKPIFLIIFPVTVILGFVSFTPITHDNILNCELPDFSNYSAHSHLNYFEDDIKYTETSLEVYKSEAGNDFQLIAIGNFPPIFYNEIWRPPKNS